MNIDVSEVLAQMKAVKKLEMELREHVATEVSIVNNIQIITQTLQTGLSQDIAMICRVSINGATPITVRVDDAISSRDIASHNLQAIAERMQQALARAFANEVFMQFAEKSTWPIR